MFRYIAIGSEQPQPTATFDRLRAALGAKKDWQLAFQRSGFEVHVTGVREPAHRAYPLPDRRGLVLGRLFRRSAPGAGGSTSTELSPSDGERILRSDGQALIDEYWGRYIAFLPSWLGSIRVLRDPTGTLPCFFLHLDGVTLVFSWLEDVLELLPASAQPQVHWDAVAAHMLLGKLGSTETALHGVHQVLPGYLVTVSESKPNAQRLWSAVDVARDPWEDDIETSANELRQTVIACVQHWASCYAAILLRLSGGVDSAILLASLDPDLARGSVTCLNYHSLGADSDERRFARLAAQRAGTRLVERCRDADFQLTEVLEAARMPAPSSHLGRMGAGRIDAQTAAEAGALAMFTGAGGDQLFFERRCTWPAADYLVLRGLNRGFFAAALDAAHLGRVSFWQAIQRAAVDRFFQPDPLQDLGRYVTLMRADALEAATQNAERFLHPGLLAAQGLPIGKFRQVQELINPFDCYDPFLREAAPELVHPLVSQPLMELCLRTPTFRLTQGGRGRALARRAFASHLPREIATRRSKGGMLEHVTGILHRNLEVAKRLLLDGNLARQGLVDRQRIEATLSGLPSGMSGHVSEIHHLIAIEAWTQGFAPTAGPASV